MFSECGVSVAKKETKRDLMIQAASIAHSARTEEKLQDAMNNMLWVMAKGTRYQKDVELAFEALEKMHDLRYRP